MQRSVYFHAWRVAALLATWCIAAAALPAIAVADPIPVADFFKPAAFSNLVMSPSGKRICAIVPGPEDRLRLAVLDLEDLAQSKIVAAYTDADIWDARWVNDTRLVFRLFDQHEALAQQRGSGLFAVDVQANDAPRMLVRPKWELVHEATAITSRTLPPSHELHSLLRDGSNDVIMAQYSVGNTGQLLNVNLLRLDTVTGLARSLSRGCPAGTVTWTLDHAAQPRLVVAIAGAREATYWKASAYADWVKIEEGGLYSEQRTFEPFYVDSASHVYATARLGPKDDTSSLVIIDIADGKMMMRSLLSAPGYDFSGQIVLNAGGAVLGVRYLTDAQATHWFDAGLKKIQEQVDALLPATNHRLDCGNCDQRDQVLVTSSSDRQPAVYRLFDTKAGALASIVESRSWIRPQAMATRDMVRVKARDGMDIPVHITRPPGPKGPLPMVVLVHGGPWVRGGEWLWEPQSQFLASRGYLVVEPEFRGSTGFGFKHFRSGWKQRGLAMQDDVADAAQWAIKQGNADPRRICIAGASYGGYAALMGLIRNPEIFRCGVEWVGVTDIDLMYSITWSDISDPWLRYGMPKMVGDRTNDAAQLAATSPIKLADRVTQPLLMAYGGIDRRVPLDHGTRFRDAVRKTNKQVEWIVYPDEGHGWLLPANNIDFWTRVERFLDKNLKNAP